MSLNRLPRCLNRQAKWDSIVNTCDSLVKWYNLLVRILSDPDSESPIDELSGDFDRRNCLRFLLEAVSQRHHMGKGTYEYKLFDGMLDYNLEQLREIVHVSRDGWVIAADTDVCSMHDESMWGDDDDDDDDEFFSDADQDVPAVTEEKEAAAAAAAAAPAAAPAAAAPAAAGDASSGGGPFPIVTDPHQAASAVTRGHSLTPDRSTGQRVSRDEREEEVKKKKKKKQESS